MKETTQNNLNILNQSYSYFLELLNYSYDIKLAKNGKITDIKLIFLEVNFIHMSGLNKLKDVSLVDSTNTSVLYKLFKNNRNKLREEFAKSTYFISITNRLKAIINLRTNFYKAQDNKHYKFIQKSKSFYSKIKYDYIIKCEFDGDVYYYFLRQRNNPEEYVVVSTFIENSIDYSVGQSFVALLKKEEINNKTGHRTLIYKKSNFEDV